MAYTRIFSLLTLLCLAVFTLAAPTELETRNNYAGGATVKFTINLTWENNSPIGGTPRKSILVNETIPGPPLRIHVGDTVHFLVHNNLPNETAVHFHGIEQLNTPWSDGVPGLSQKPIAPGKSYMYTWTANYPGMYFYHGHYRAQMMDGLYGAIIIQPKDISKLPFDYINNASASVKAMTAADKAIQPIFISDWSKYTSKEFFDIQTAGNIDDACTDAIIINGKGSEYCLTRDELTAYTNPALPPLLAAVNPPQITDKGCLPPNLPATEGNFTFDVDAIPADAFFTCTPTTGPMTSIDVDPAQQWAALSFISPAGFSTLKVTIDGHKMWVYGADGQYVIPQEVDQLIVANGDRYSVLIQLNQAPAQYSIRVANGGLNQVISGFAVLNYKGATGPASSDPNALATMNYAGVNLTQILPFIDARGSPFPPVQVSQTSDVTFSFDIKKLGQPFGAYQWTLSGVEGFNSSEEEVPTPLLYQNPSTVQTSDLILKTKKGQWVDLIVKVEGPIAQPHPMHKHSNKAFVIGSGVGAFNFTSVAAAQAAMPAGTFNLVNPPYRDGFTTPPAEGNSSWLALRYHVENPGAFLFHCHIQTHFTGGMAIALLDGVDAWPKVPQQYLNGNGVTQSLKSMGKVHSKS